MYQKAHNSLLKRLEVKKELFIEVVLEASSDLEAWLGQNKCSREELIISLTRCSDSYETTDIQFIYNLFTAFSVKNFYFAFN